MAWKIIVFEFEYVRMYIKATIVKWNKRRRLDTAAAYQSQPVFLQLSWITGHKSTHYQRRDKHDMHQENLTNSSATDQQTQKEISNLLCNNRQHFKLNPIELIKTRPCTGRRQTFEELHDTTMYTAHYYVHLTSHLECFKWFTSVFFEWEPSEPWPSCTAIEC